MTPAEIVTALERHGTRIAVEGERVRLVFNRSAPPDDLIRAAREAKAALREIVGRARASGSISNGTEEERATVIGYGGGAPREWSEALARLDPNKPPGDVPPQRWVRFLDDAHAFLASDWPRQAGELGWSALDLFGCHPVAPYARHDRRGLVWSFGECGGGRLVAMTGDTAVIERPTGSHQTFRRLVAAGDVVLPWVLRE